MTYEEITNRNMNSGIQVIFQYVNDVTDGLFMPLVLLMVYMTLAMGMYFAQKRMTGKGNAAICFAVSSWVMVGFVTLLAMIPGLISGITVVEIAVLSVVSTLWLLFSKNNNY